MKIAERVRNLSRQGPEDSSLAHLAWREGWIKNSFLCNLNRAAKQSAKLLCRIDPRASWLQHRSGWQGHLTKIVAKQNDGQALNHMRQRLERWNLSTLPGHRMARALKVLETLARRSAPRVQAAYMRTLWNGWCTKRRFQQQGGCPFRCPHGADSIERISVCLVVRHMWAAHLPGHFGRGIRIF